MMCFPLLLLLSAKVALEKRVEQLEKDHQELLNENIRITEDSHSLVRTLTSLFVGGGGVCVCMRVLGSFQCFPIHTVVCKRHTKCAL